MSDQYLEAARGRTIEVARCDCLPTQSHQGAGCFIDVPIPDEITDEIIRAWVGDRGLYAEKACECGGRAHNLSANRFDCSQFILIRVSVTEGEPTTSEVSIRDDLVVEGEPT